MAKILLVADTPNWIFDRNAWLLKGYINYHEIDIAYAGTGVPESKYWRRAWKNMELSRHYDVIWLMHPTFNRILHFPDTTWEKYVKWHNERGTQVILGINHLQEKHKYIDTLQYLNLVTTNNLKMHKVLADHGVQAHYTPNGYPEKVFKTTTEFEDRPFQILWVGSESRKEHKGYHIFEQVQKAFQGMPSVKFKAIVADSFDFDNILYTQKQMNEFYNESQVFVCMSKSEGGPNPLLESAACGCIPISTDVGYANNLIVDGENGFVVERDAVEFVKKINFLRSNKRKRDMMSAKISVDVQKFSWKNLSQNYARFLNRAVAKVNPSSIKKMIHRPKHKVLIVADTEGWCYDNKAHVLKDKITNHKIEVGYVDTSDPAKLWTNMIEKNEYDVIWMLGTFLPTIRENKEFIQKMNHRGVRVLLSVNGLYGPGSLQSDHVEYMLVSGGELHESTNTDLISGDSELAKRLPYIKEFNSVTVNNLACWHLLKQAGLDVSITPDGAADLFKYDVPIEEREFKVIWVGARIRAKHKGHDLFLQLRDRLAREAIGFIDIVGDSQTGDMHTLKEMNDLYNESVIYCCLSESEGGPGPLVESIQCGCVPITTRVGQSEDIDNIFICDRNVDAFVEKILHLKENRDVLHKMSHAVREEAKRWTWDLRYKPYNDFLDEAARKII
jgi:glycosyltransferase involved in cell wall biosynthesis